MLSYKKPQNGWVYNSIFHDVYIYVQKDKESMVGQNVIFILKNIVLMIKFAPLQITSVS